jgi:hypothetical protein
MIVPVLNGITGRGLCTTWLLCITLVAASLDRVPDPPATKEGDSHSQFFGAIEQVQPSVQLNQDYISSLSDAPSAQSWLAFAVVSDVRYSIQCPLVRQAADPSPPSRAE